ncbi:MAG TPA: hypothetical protein VGU61_07005 [Noviherbaspirillum sp.]|jgi:hypothetical protein|uniref:hypothetical protein n=1 Tax=Noviherbaspirillum sp. TaxID=1926288 RepID=UPI002DDCCB9B|nr:hypothetical protein [Noviherbaspirillum sp.]HEV2609999.1 hypothetical protein [Noviherbaspirillum sp.]
MNASISKPVPETASWLRAYDVFNGDADGICALHQLRLVHPREATLVTGVKRDIDLLKRIPPGEKADVTVLDISLVVNAPTLLRILHDGGQVAYFDHHSGVGPFPHAGLTLHWDDSPDVCTSILVDRHLGGVCRKWAVVAAFGDNLDGPAQALAASIGVDRRRLQELEELGRLINYNAYGERVEDLHVAPDILYLGLRAYTDPFDFIHGSDHFRLLSEGYRDDAARMRSLSPASETEGGAIYLLPDAPWARRISGTFANKLASEGTPRSYAVLTERSDGGYVVSVRSGQPELRSANRLCDWFPTGGGRKAAAGINCLAADDLENFARAFHEYFAPNYANGVPARVHVE